MGLRAGLERCGKFHPTGSRSPDRPARRQSLYRLRYRAHRIFKISLLFLVFAFDGPCDGNKDVIVYILIATRAVRKVSSYSEYF